MRKINFLIRTLALSIFIFCISLAQQRYKSEANADVIRYTVKDGLTVSSISSVSQTADGYIWISGLEGTVRFNGYEFQQPGKEFGLSDMQYNYYDSTSNTLYFASPDRFLILKNNSFQSFTDKNGFKTSGLPGRTVSFIKKDSKKRVWIGTSTFYTGADHNGSLTLFENGKFTLLDSSKFPLDNATNMFETPYADLIFFSDGSNTSTYNEAYIALYKNGKFQRIDESKGVNFCGTTYNYKKVMPVVDDKGNTWIPFIGAGNIDKLRSGTSGVLMYDGKEFHSYPGLQEYLTGNIRVTSVLYLEKEKTIYATIADLNGTVYSKNTPVLFKFVSNRWQKIDLYKDIGEINNLSTKEKLSDFKFTFTQLIPGSKIFPDLLAIGVLDETSSAEYNDQYFYFNNGWKKYDGFKGFPFTSIKEAVFILNPLGFSLYYPNNSTLLTSKDGLVETKSVYPWMYSDKNGIIWIYHSDVSNPPGITIGHSGINVWDGSKLHKITTMEGLSSNTVMGLTEDSAGRIWLATDKGLDLARAISTRNNQWIIKINPIKKIDGKPYSVSNVLVTKSGDIYTWQKYVRPNYNDIPKADFFLGKVSGDNIIEIPNSLPEKVKNIKYQRHNLYELPNGNLMLASSFSEHMYELESSKSSLMIYNDGKWSDPPQTWNVPDKNLYYVGTIDNKMYFLSPGYFYSFDGNRFTDLSDSVNEHADFRILKEASSAGTTTNIQAGNYLYIRVRLKGLAIFDGKNLDFYTTKNGLPTANIWDPITDLKENVYFVHNLGGLIINGERLNSYYNDNSNLRGPTAISQDAEKNILLWYPNIGLYVAKETTFKNEIKLSSVKVNSHQYYYDLPSTFSYSDNSFIFNYTVLNYKNPKSTNYQHKLEGYDLDWSKASNLQFSEYQNLPPGNYVFKVKAQNESDNNTNEASFKFTITPPVWNTWYAYLFYFGLIIFSLLTIRKYEKQRIAKREQEKIEKEKQQAQIREAELRAQIAETESNRKTQELEEARQLQLSMLPKELPQLPNLDIAVYMKTATEVGGDYYDFHVHLDGTLTVILGDATGHGMMSGMMVSIMKSLFMSDRTNKEIKPFFENASSAIKDMQLGRLMMALTCVQISKNKIITSNAGMPPLYIYRKNSQSIEEVVINNMPLGAMKNIIYDTKELEIDRGDTLLLMSDGFAELRNDSKEIFGYKRARNSFEEVALKKPEEIVKHLTDEGKHWTNNKEPEDDVTFVVIKVK